MLGNRSHPSRSMLKPTLISSSAPPRLLLLQSWQLTALPQDPVAVAVASDLQQLADVIVLFHVPSRQTALTSSISVRTCPAMPS